MQADTEELDLVSEVDEPEEVEEEVEQSTEPEAEAGEEAEDEDVVVSIGEESPPSEEDENQAKPWVRELRKSSREKDRKIRELEEKLRTSASPAVRAPVELGKKPTLEECDYDAEQFESKLEAWHQRKLEQATQEEEKRKAAEAESKAWQARVDQHNKLKSELKVKDFDDAEAAVEEAFSVTQRGVIVHGAKNSALLFYALGKNPKKAKELASITDPVKFAFAAAELETQLKVSPRKSAPLPERQVRGSAPSAGAVDSKLARLEAEADKSGDRSKVVAYKRSLKAAGK